MDFQDKDPAMLVYGRDFYEDEAVKLMSLEQEAIYWRLLLHSWSEGSIPKSPRDLCAIVGKLSLRRFEKLWAGIAAKWISAGHGRLVNPRQERERDKRAANRKRLSDAGRRGNAARWGEDDPPPSPPSDHLPIAGPATPLRSQNGRKQVAGPAIPMRSPPDRSTGDRNRIASKPSQAKPIPLSPSDPNSEAIPSCSPGGAPAQQDGSAADSGPAGIGGTEERAIYDALLDSPYRANARARPSRVLRAALRCRDAGVGKADLLRLAHLAKARGDKPDHLFAHWVDHLDEALKELGKR